MVWDRLLGLLGNGTVARALIGQLFLSGQATHLLQNAGYNRHRCPYICGRIL